MLYLFVVLKNRQLFKNNQTYFIASIILFCLAGLSDYSFPLVYYL